MSVPESKICSFFSSGKRCRFGKNCRFSHSLENQQQEILLEDTGGQNGSVREANVKACFAFSQQGWCRFGTKCKYAHIVPVDEAQLEETPSTTSNSGSSLRQHEGYTSFSVPSIGGGIHPPLDQPPGPTPHGNFDDWCARRQYTGANSPSVSSPAIKPREDVRSTYNRQNAPQARGASSRGKRPCKFFLAGHCTMGSRCRFLHPGDAFIPQIEPELNYSAQANHRQANPRSRARPSPRPTEFSLEELTSEEAKKLRQSEIDSLKKRFPKFTQEIDNDVTWFEFSFKASDPDWGFDVKEVDLQVSFPAEYPQKVMRVRLPAEQILPETVIRHIKRMVAHWLADRFEDKQRSGKAELVFRAFLKWLDKTLEEMFTEGLKQFKRKLVAEAAGVQFITPSELKEEFAGRGSSEDDEEEDADESDEDSEEETDSEAEDDGGANKENSRYQQRVIDLDPTRKGTEVKFMNLQLAENATSLQVTKLSVQVQCDRCKNKMDFSTPPARVNSVACTKCNQNLLLTFRPSLAHQFTSVVGYLDLVGCVAFDLVLVDCHFVVACFNCDKVNNVEGLSPGQPKDAFCVHCHRKLRVATDNVRFQQLQASDPLDASRVHQVNIIKPKKVAKDPAIQEGRPLPNKGTCKHYKKSFRWLRFPCCGKAYPCDVCHDENEGDHDMKYANRMICGFCCKEQYFASDKPCIACGSSMTNKSTAHWEGGKGCRDSSKMARTDAKKYANKSKTLSRVAQAKKEGSSKATKAK